jgi:hypothetical protein
MTRLLVRSPIFRWSYERSCWLFTGRSVLPLVRGKVFDLGSK